jgi:hypothetical protein
VQDTNVLLILSVVGLGLVCVVGLFFVGGFVLRLFKGPIFSFFGLLANNVDDGDDGTTPFARRPKPDLKAIAQQHDFDTALTSQHLQGNTPGAASTVQLPRQSPLGTQEHPRLQPPGEQPNTLPPSLQRAKDGRGRNDNRDRRDTEDDIFGGLLGDDGDDSVL